jgi:hypothetical protein
MKRFDELIDQGEQIKEICKKVYFSGNKRALDPEQFEAWRTSCLSLLKSTFGSSSPHFDSFVNRKFFDFYNSTQIYLGILKGAKEDLAKGYFFHKDLMLSVNIFDSLINRAGRQLAQGRVTEARAVIKAVLAEVLTKICENKSVACEAGENAEALLDHLTASGALPDDVAAGLRDLSRRLEDGFSGEKGSFGEKGVSGEKGFSGGEAGSPAHGPLGADQVAGAIESLVTFLDEYLGSQIIILN